MDSRTPFKITNGKQESNATLLYTKKRPEWVGRPAIMNEFEVLRYRFRFTALDDICFPAGATGNIIRGAFGLALRDTAPRELYERLFEPRAQPGTAPSGLFNLPRPFVFRWPPIPRGWTLRTGEDWDLTLHLFDPSQGLAEFFQDALASWKKTGIGPRRGRLHLDGLDQLGALNIRLESLEPAVRVSLNFRSPTEIKNEGQVAPQPEFPILFGRLRDRIATLRALYQSGPPGVGFRGLGDRSQSVRIRSKQITWERASRTSSRTGQTHPVGGFTGSVEYEGDLSEFMPWLRAGEFTGVGRQTSWGKGDIQVGSVTKP